MNLEQLHSKLQELGIMPDRYYLHGLFGSAEDEGKPSLTIVRGKYFVEYHVYFKERGQKHSIRVFTNENEACVYFLKQFKDI